jgi:hypothetical protein
MERTPNKWECYQRIENSVVRKVNPNTYIKYGEGNARAQQRDERVPGRLGVVWLALLQRLGWAAPFDESSNDRC